MRCGAQRDARRHPVIADRRRVSMVLVRKADSSEGHCSGRRHSGASATILFLSGWTHVAQPDTLVHGGSDRGLTRLAMARLTEPGRAALAYRLRAGDIHIGIPTRAIGGPLASLPRLLLRISA